MKFISNVLILVLFAVGGWYSYNKWFATEKEDPEPDEVVETKNVLPDIESPYDSYVECLDKAWHLPDSKNALLELEKELERIDDPTLCEYTLILAAMGARLQKDKEYYRKIGRRLTADYPHGSAKNMLSNRFISEYCKECGGKGKTISSCPACKGTGKCPNTPCVEGVVRYLGLNNKTVSHECSMCHGTGKCTKCGGTGGAPVTCPKCNGSGRSGVVTDASIKRTFRNGVCHLINYVKKKKKAFAGYDYIDGKWVTEPPLDEPEKTEDEFISQTSDDSTEPLIDAPDDSPESPENADR